MSAIKPPILRTEKKAKPVKAKPNCADTVDASLPNKEYLTMRAFIKSFNLLISLNQRISPQI